MCSPDKQQQQLTRARAHAPQQQPELSAPQSPSKRSVSFSTVTIRHYPLTLGTVNPYSTLSSSASARAVGAPLTLSWEYDQLPSQSLDSYEASRGDGPRKTSSQMRMSADRRRAILELQKDVSREEVDEAERMARKAEERRLRYLAWCRGEEGSEGSSSTMRRSRSRRPAEPRPAQRPSFPPLDDCKDDDDRDAPRKADDECIALLRRRGLAAAASARIPPSGATVGKAGPVRRRMISSRAA